MKTLNQKHIEKLLQDNGFELREMGEKRKLLTVSNKVTSCLISFSLDMTFLQYYSNEKINFIEEIDNGMSDKEIIQTVKDFLKKVKRIQKIELKIVALKNKLQEDL